MSRQLFRSASLLLQHGGIVTLCALGVLLPPLSEWSHVVSRDCCQRAYRIAVKVCKFHTIQFWHLLYLKTEYTQTIQYRSNTVGHHAQVFATDEHVGGTKHCRQSVVASLSPEHIVSLIKVIVVKPHVGILFFRRQTVVDGLAESFDTWVVHVCLPRVFHEEYIAYQAVQPVTNPQAILIATAFKNITDAPLCAYIFL